MITEILFYIQGSMTHTLKAMYLVSLLRLQRTKRRTDRPFYRENASKCPYSRDPLPILGEFFSTSCVPGALSPAYNGKLQNPRMMCELCGGDSGGDFCAKNMDEPYYGHTGAFKCLVEKGDVAFTSHRAVLGRSRSEIS